ncbi:MAG: helix-turn-helix domain-containing GNAT family N-acetyltransferase [Bacteroidota bacterium]
MFYQKVGKMAIGSRMRALSDRVLEDAQRVYELYGIAIKSRWFPVFYLLSDGAGRSITDLAVEIGQSHPSVIATVREMVKAEVVTEAKDPLDGRKKIVQLSAKGRRFAERAREQYLDVNAAVEVMLAQTSHQLWEAMDEFEYLLEQHSMFQRVVEQRKRREQAAVQIVPYAPEYRRAFHDLNEEWIQRYFTMEATDYQSLDHPDTYILDPGGVILVALYRGEPVGVCALIVMEDPAYDFELAKMAVSPRAQGRGIGWRLGRAIIDRAREMGAQKLYLESNTVLTPAIKLYQKLGFRKITGHPTPYSRCNIQMELLLTGIGHSDQ